MKVNYSQLDQVLRDYGFTYRTVNRARFYEHPGTGALVAIAYYPDSAEVLPAHLDSARIALKVYDIADAMDFAVQLYRAGAVVSPPPNGDEAAKHDAEAASTSTDGRRVKGGRR